MWSVHNECSLRLNHMNLSNHGSDEMMVVRTELLSQLPDGLVNDGAYIAGNARLRGYSVKFCNEAPVRIDVPSRCVESDQAKAEDHLWAFPSVALDRQIPKNGRITPARLS